MHQGLGHLRQLDGRLCRKPKTGEQIGWQSGLVSAQAAAGRTHVGEWDGHPSVQLAVLQLAACRLADERGVGEGGDQEHEVKVQNDADGQPELTQPRLVLLPLVGVPEEAVVPKHRARHQAWRVFERGDGQAIHELEAAAAVVVDVASQEELQRGHVVPHGDLVDGRLRRPVLGVEHGRQRAIRKRVRKQRLVRAGVRREAVLHRNTG